MPTLFVPPTEFVTENPEVATRLRASAESFVNGKLAELGLRGAPRRTEMRGAFRGLREFEWNGPRDALLGSVFLLPSGKVQASEFSRVVFFVWRDDCLLAGANWEPGTAPLRGMPTEAQRGGGSLAQQSARSPGGRSPLRWESSATGPHSKRLSLLFEAIGGEQLAAGGEVVNASLARLACKWIPPRQEPLAAAATPNSVSSNAEVTSDSKEKAAPSAPLSWPAVVPTPAVRKPDFPRRAHRVVRAELTFSGPGDAWPGAVANVFTTDGVFGSRKETLVGADPEGKTSPFAPVSLAQAAARALAPSVHDVRQTSFAVVRRRGRWLYLNRGRAYGLEIGTHLIGPGGAKLHIIQFAPDDKGVDVGIALVREEALASPLKEGDVLTFDGTEFPLRSAPSLETNPL
jgi:hypothetical protein